MSSRGPTFSLHPSAAPHLGLVFWAPLFLCVLSTCAATPCSALLGVTGFGESDATRDLAPPSHGPGARRPIVPSLGHSTTRDFQPCAPAVLSLFQSGWG